MLDYLQIFICIITAVVYIIISLIIGQNVDQTLLRLIYVIVISYIAGLILKIYLKKSVFVEEKVIPDNENEEVVVDSVDYNFEEDEDDF